MALFNNATLRVGSSLVSDAFVGLVSVRTDYYIDAVNGLDANDGHTPATAKQTIGSVTLTAGINIRLARGSKWREKLMSAFPNVYVGAYGAGALPIIDGSDVVTAWTAQGAANVYQASVAQNGLESERITVYENGSMLTRVADAAACSALPGSFVGPRADAGTPATVMVNPTGSGNPTSNGHTYEVSVRHTAFAGISGSAVRGVEVGRSLDNNGPVDFVNVAGVSVDRIFANGYTKHAIGIGNGSITDCCALMVDPPTSYELSNTSYVAYLDTPAGAYLLERAFATYSSDPGLTAFFTAHGNLGGQQFASGTLRQCGMSGPGYGGHNASGAVVSLTEGCAWLNAKTARGDGGTSAYTLMSTNGLHGEHQPTGGVMTDCVYFGASRTTVGNWNNHFQGGGVGVISDWQRCSFHAIDCQHFHLSTGDSGSTIRNRCVFYTTGFAISIGAGTTYVGDHNIFKGDQYGNQVVLQNAGAMILTLAAWQAATGQDTNSVYVKEVDQAGANRLYLNNPETGDFTLNPLAKVYGGDGSAYIGAFPDLTPITTSGAQSRWDWNTRSAASGAPTVFPTLPTTASDARTYVEAPASWNFYP